jgi:hypothetical protein
MLIITFTIESQYDAHDIKLRHIPHQAHIQIPNSNDIDQEENETILIIRSTLTVRPTAISFEPTRNEILFFREKTFSKFAKLFDTEKTFNYKSLIKAA